MAPNQVHLHEQPLVCRNRNFGEATEARGDAVDGFSTLQVFLDDSPGRVHRFAGLCRDCHVVFQSVRDTFHILEREIVAVDLEHSAILRGPTRATTTAAGRVSWAA
jgi:hypothetical protein